jgi:hypothetical protein
MKRGYYNGHGLSSVKEDIRRMCRDAMKYVYALCFLIFLHMNELFAIYSSVPFYMPLFTYIKKN